MPILAVLHAIFSIAEHTHALTPYNQRVWRRKRQCGKMSARNVKRIKANRTEGQCNEKTMNNKIGNDGREKWRSEVAAGGGQ